MFSARPVGLDPPTFTDQTHQSPVPLQLQSFMAFVHEDSIIQNTVFLHGQRGAHLPIFTIREAGWSRPIGCSTLLLVNCGFLCITFVCSCFEAKQRLENSSYCGELILASLRNWPSGVFVQASIFAPCS